MLRYRCCWWLDILAGWLFRKGLNRTRRSFEVILVVDMILAMDVMLGIEGILVMN